MPGSHGAERKGRILLAVGPPYHHRASASFGLLLAHRELIVRSKEGLEQELQELRNELLKSEILCL